MEYRRFSEPQAGHGRSFSTSSFPQFLQRSLESPIGGLPAHSSTRGSRFKTIPTPDRCVHRLGDKSLQYQPGRVYLPEHAAGTPGRVGGAHPAGSRGAGLFARSGRLSDALGERGLAAPGPPAGDYGWPTPGPRNQPSPGQGRTGQRHGSDSPGHHHPDHQGHAGGCRSSGRPAGNQPG